MSIYCFDIDGTICHTEGSDYLTSTPLSSRILLINRLFEQGHKIIIFTARGSSSGKDWKDLTEIQLTKWGVRYHELILGKPAADYYIDNKGINDTEFFSSINDIRTQL